MHKKCKKETRETISLSIPPLPSSSKNIPDEIHPVSSPIPFQENRSAEPEQRRLRGTSCRDLGESKTTHSLIFASLKKRQLSRPNCSPHFPFCTATHVFQCQLPTRIKTPLACKTKEMGPQPWRMLQTWKTRALVVGVSRKTRKKPISQILLLPLCKYPRSFLDMVASRPTLLTPSS